MSYATQTNITVGLRATLEIWLFSAPIIVPCCVFLFINIIMLFTLRSKLVFRETSRYVLLFNLLCADTMQMALSQLLYLLAACRIRLTYPVCGVLAMLTDLTNDISPLTLVTMSLERYVAVCFPLRHTAIITMRSTAVAVAAVWTFSSLNILIRVILLLDFPFEDLESLQMNDYCAKPNMILGPKSADYDRVYTLFLFLSASVAIMSSYIGVMIAARSASTDKASVRKARNTLLLHLVQLGLSLSSTVYIPLITAVSNITDRIAMGDPEPCGFHCLRLSSARAASRCARSLAVVAMVQMMESQCEYFMYFPAVPITDLSDPARYRSLPRRSHLYLGETVRFLLVLRCRDAGATPPEPGPAVSVDGGAAGFGTESASGRAWRELAGSLCAVASVSPGESSRHRGGHHHHEYQSGGDEAHDDGEDYIAAAEAAILALGSRMDSRCRSFRDCKPLLIHNTSGTAAREFRRAPVQSPLDEPVVLMDEVIFPLTVSLDKLPVSTLKVKVMVTVWKKEADKAEVQELGYLSVLQQREPTHTFRHDLNTFKAQVSTTLTVLPPPTVRCKQMTVSGRHLAVLKVLNESSQEEVSVRDVRILPNLNASYLPMMPDGSVLLVDNVCHRSGEVGMASFCRVESPACRLPSMLSALEEHDFLFQLHLNDMPADDTNEGMEVPLVAVLQWSTPKMPFTNCIYTHYRLPSIRLDEPRFVMTASCPSTVKVKEHFKVKYVLLNNLQDFLAVRLVWTPEGRGQPDDPSLAAVVCHSPLSNLGHCRKGSTLSFRVPFQILKPGLYELSQHMKLKLQFTASVSNPPPDARPLSRKNSPSSPAFRDLLDRHQASLGRSQSFSHQQPSRSHIMRTGSAMERRAITPPVGSPVGRPLYLPPQDKSLLSLDKIAKRECKVLVVDPAS